MIDYHCHLLPGLDDGAADRAEALLMAHALADFGFRETYCTPHCIRGQYEISPVEVRAAVLELQPRLAAADIPLHLRPGMEYSLDAGFEKFAANLLPLGESRLVLCEAPQQGQPDVIVAMLELILAQGFTPLVAHPERSERLCRLLLARHDQPAGEETSAGGEDRRSSWLGRLFAARAPARPGPASAPPAGDLPAGCLLQANLGSFAGFYGAGPQRRAYELLQRGAYHCLASDLHDAVSTAAILEPAREKLMFNPALQKLGAFRPPHGAAGNSQLAFW